MVTVYSIPLQLPAHARLVNFMPLTCRYCALVAPNNDFKYCFTDCDISYSPVFSAYSNVSRDIRALLNAVMAASTALFRARKSVSKPC